MFTGSLFSKSCVKQDDTPMNEYKGIEAINYVMNGKITKIEECEVIKFMNMENPDVTFKVTIGQMIYSTLYGTAYVGFYGSETVYVKQYPVFLNEYNMVGHDDYHQTYKRMSLERRVAKNMKIYAGVGLGPNAERLMVLREPVGTPVQLAFDMIKESKRNVGEKETIEIFRALRSGIIQTVDNFTLMGVNIDPYQMIITDGNEILSPGDIHNTFMDLNAQSTKNVRYLKMWSLLYQNAVSIFGEAHPETVAIGVKVSEMKSLVDKERK